MTTGKREWNKSSIRAEAMPFSSRSLPCTRRFRRPKQFGGKGRESAADWRSSGRRFLGVRNQGALRARRTSVSFPPECNSMPH